jgi:hypothetical protein
MAYCCLRMFPDLLRGPTTPLLPPGGLHKRQPLIMPRPTGSPLAQSQKGVSFTPKRCCAGCMACSTAGLRKLSLPGP